MAELIRGSLVVALSGSPGGIEFGAIPSTAVAGGFGWGASVDLSADGTVLVTGDTNNDEVKTFDFSGGAWVERSTSPIDAGGFRDFGSGVALSADGTVLAVGEPNKNGAGTNRGEVHIYDYNSGTGAWDLRNSIVGGANNDFLGFCVDLNSDATKLYVGWRTGANAQILTYDWVDPNWVLDVSATLPRPSGTVVTPTDNWGKNFRVTPDGSRMIATYSGDTTGNLGTVVGAWEWNGSGWTRIGGELFSALGDNDEEQPIGVTISDDGLTLYVLWYGTGFSWVGRIEVYDWVDPNWVTNASKSAVYDTTPAIEANVDIGDTTGLWISSDENTLAAALYDNPPGGSDVYFWGLAAGDLTPCITKTVDTANGPVVIGTYCADALPPDVPWEEDPVNVPRPPVSGDGTVGQNEQVNVNCTDKGFYQVYSDVGPAVNANAEYEQWLAENFWSVDFNDGVCN